MYEYHTAAAVVVSEFEWYNHSSGSVILVHVIAVPCWSLVCFQCPNPLNLTAPAPAAVHSRYAGKIDVICFFLSAATLSWPHTAGLPKGSRRRYLRGLSDETGAKK